MINLYFREDSATVSVDYNLNYNPLSVYPDEYWNEEDALELWVKDTVGLEVFQEAAIQIRGNSEPDFLKVFEAATTAKTIAKLTGCSVVWKMECLLMSFASFTTADKYYWLDLFND